MLNYRQPSGLGIYYSILFILTFYVFFFAACNKNDPYALFNEPDRNARLFGIELFHDASVTAISVSALDRTPLYLRKKDVDMLPVSAGYEIVFTESDGNIAVVSEKIDTVFYGEVEIVKKSGELLLKPFEINAISGRTIRLRSFLTISSEMQSITVKADCYEHDLIAAMMTEIVKKDDPQSFKEAVSVLARTNLYTSVAEDRGTYLHESERLGIILGPRLPQKFHYNAIKKTEGYISVFHTQPVFLYSTEICGGMTATPDMIWQELPAEPHYQVVLCDDCLSSGSYEWVNSVDSQILGELLFGNYAHVEIWISKFYENGRPQHITAQMGDIKKTFTVEEFRKKIAQGDGSGIILSDWFEIHNIDGSSEKVQGLRSLSIDYYNVTVPESEEVHFKGWGIGHGVGLCRQSAREKAKSGETFPEIIKNYYPKLVTIRTGSEY